MLDENILFDKITILFKNFLDNNPIPSRRIAFLRRNSILRISILSKNDDNVILEFSKSICNTNVSQTICVNINVRKKQAKIVSVDNVLDTNVISELNKFIKYFEKNGTSELDKKFENTKVLNYVVVPNVDGKACYARKHAPKHIEVSVDLGMGNLIYELTENNFIVLFSCIGHKNAYNFNASYVSLFCKNSEFNMIKNIIKKHFNVQIISNETDKHYWKNLRNGSKFATFRWVNPLL